MVGTASNAGLRLKARNARDGQDARVMSPARALRLAVEKAADEDFSIALRVGAIGRSLEDHGSLLEMIADGGLLLLLDGPSGALGLMTVDTATLTSLIEIQTTGKITSRPVQSRAVTRTDAVLVAPLVDGILRRTAQHLGDHPDSHWTRGFRFGAMIEDRRSLGLALLAPDYHVLQIPLEIGQGARTGELVLALPVPERPAEQMAKVEQVKVSPEFQARVMDAPARLQAILCRLSLPLSQMGQLSTGTLLPLPPDVLRDISLEAGGRAVAKAQLGKLHGMRALRVKMPGQSSRGQDQTGEERGDAVTDWDKPVPADQQSASPADYDRRRAVPRFEPKPADAGRDDDQPWTDQQQNAPSAFDDEPAADQAFDAYAGRMTNKSDKGIEAA
jgi:flagellar motor switch protein FliM